MKLLSSVIVLSSYKSTVNTCMKYNCYACTGAPSCCLDMLDKLYKWICRTSGTILFASLGSLRYGGNVDSLCLSYRYQFSRCSFELTELVPFLYSRGKSTRYSDWYHEFSLTIYLCQQLYSLHRYKLEFSACRMFSSNLWSE